jgi:hypothetical protein
MKIVLIHYSNNIANAKIAGLPDTLGISNAQYNTCLMIFYVGCKSDLRHFIFGTLHICLVVSSIHSSMKRD